MRRAPIVLAGTAAGLAAVLSYHTAATSSSLDLGSLSAGATSSSGSGSGSGSGSTSSSSSTSTSTPAGSTGSTSSGSTGSTSSGSTGSTASGSTGSTSSGSTGSTSSGSTGSTSSGSSTSGGGSSSSSSGSSSTRTAVGSSVNYLYGVLSVQVTVKGSTITDVGIASLDDGGNFRSQSIDQQAIPILEQEALQAQSASIQSVSGATYTSQGFTRSLQSALSKLGI